MARQSQNFSAEFDAYIEKAAPFARPILKRLRRLFHQACPEIKEVMKWNFPHFEYRGIVGSMAAFKQHVGWGFWKAKLMQDPQEILAAVGTTSMGGMKVTSAEELPPDDVILAYVAEAIALNESGAKAPKPKKKPAPEVEVPEDLQLALKKNKSARTTFENFSNSHRKEYVQWITEAKREETRKKRLATTIEWLSEGKPQNWKYVKK